MFSFPAGGVDTAWMMKIIERVLNTITAAIVMPTTVGERSMVKLTAATMMPIMAAIASNTTDVKRRVECLE